MVCWDIELGTGRGMFLASDHSLHSVPLEFLGMALAVDADLVVLARSPGEWKAFVQAQRDIEHNVLTVADRRMLAEMGVSWNEPFLEDSTCNILGAATGETHTLNVKFWGLITTERMKMWKCRREETSLTCNLQ
jgi:hypothetical protein